MTTSLGQEFMGRGIEPERLSHFNYTKKWLDLPLAVVVSLLTPSRTRRGGPGWRLEALRQPHGVDGRLGMGHTVVKTLNRSTERSPSQGQGRQRRAPGRPRRSGATNPRLHSDLF